MVYFVPHARQELRAAFPSVRNLFDPFYLKKTGRQLYEAAGELQPFPTHPPLKDLGGCMPPAGLNVRKAGRPKMRKRIRSKYETTATGVRACGRCGRIGHTRQECVNAERTHEQFEAVLRKFGLAAEAVPDADAVAAANGEAVPDADAVAEADGEVVPDADAEAEMDGEAVPDADAMAAPDGEAVPDADADAEAAADAANVVADREAESDAEAQTGQDEKEDEVEHATDNTTKIGEKRSASRAFTNLDYDNLGRGKRSRQTTPWSIIFE